MTNFWSDKRVLVTGGAGYLAFSLLELLKDRAASIVRLDRPGADFFPVTGTAAIHDVPADIRDASIWDDLIAGVDVIFHFAAQTSAAKADADPLADMEINVHPMVALLDACRRTGSGPAVVFAGTATECGLTDRYPVNESVPDHPVTAYDLHKWMAENALKLADRLGTVRGVTLRLANLYGPGPRSSSSDRGILNMMVRRALKGEPLTVYGSGEYVRDYLFAEDAARAFILAAEQIDAIHGNHFVIGSGTGYTIRQALQLIAERCGSRSGIVRVEPPAGLTPIEKRNFIADAAQFHSLTGWTPAVDLKTGIDRTIRFIP